MTPTNKGFQREFIRINFYDSGLSKDMIQEGLVKKDCDVLSIEATRKSSSA